MNDMYNVSLNPQMYMAFVFFQFVMGILFTQLISGTQPLRLTLNATMIVLQV